MEIKIEKIDDQQLGEVGGGFSTVSDPVYSLTTKEHEVLKELGFNLKKTNSGNYKVYYSNGTTIEPHVLNYMCSAIGVASKKNSK